MTRALASPTAKGLTKDDVIKIIMEVTGRSEPRTLVFGRPNLYA